MANEGKLLTGFFWDSPVQGMEYETQSTSGLTGEKGEFRYLPGETVTFSIGGLVLGSCRGKNIITPADLFLEVGGDIKKIRDRKVTNISCFLQSLDKGGDIEKRIVITEETRKIVSGYIYKIDFAQNEDAFSKDPNVISLFTELKSTLRTPAQGRNHLRRTLYGIRKMTDVKIPMRDGSYLLGDVYLPIQEGKYPVVMSMGPFGKAFQGGAICNEQDLVIKAQEEDKWFEEGYQNSQWGYCLSPWERGEAANSTDWVPRGYVVIAIDGRGVANSPGINQMFSLQEAKDLYDSIEWAGTQPWCNGNVGLWGTGYHAMIAWNAAQFQPPHLKAIVQICGDCDSYRDYIYVGGGLFNTFSWVAKNSCGEWKGVDWVTIAKNNPFDDPAIYGPEGSLCISPDLSKVTVPFWSAMGQQGTIHTRGASEAFFRTSSKDKKLSIVSENGIHYWAYSKEALEDHAAFFDYWLKGKKNGIMDQPPVRMLVRTGRGGYYWQDENEWPIARTKYIRYYLDASPSDWQGDGKSTNFMKLEKAVTSQERSGEYPAGVEWENGSNWKHGISFMTEPIEEDTLLAGYLKLVVWVSSTTHDMELHAAARVIDENNNEVRYSLGEFDSTGPKNFPVSFGALKVSHRKLDLTLSTVFRPYHTHRKEDYQPLKPGEPVEVEVELWPAVEVVKKGYRIRLDIQPVCGDGIGRRIYDITDQSYQLGATNTVYTGPKHPSYLQIPVIPPKQ